MSLCAGPGASMPFGCPAQCPVAAQAPAGGWDLGCHNHVDYRTCMAPGLTSTGQPPLPAACGQIPVYSCNAPNPPTSCTYNETTHAGDCACNGGQDIPYCGDINEPCCDAGLACGVDDGCGPCMRCDRNIGRSGQCLWVGGPAALGCLPPAQDWCASTGFSPLPAGCTRSMGYCALGSAVFRCTSMCACAPGGSGCPANYTVTYRQRGKAISATTPCCDVSRCACDGGPPIRDGGTLADLGTLTDAQVVKVPDIGAVPTDFGMTLADLALRAPDMPFQIPDMAFQTPDMPFWTPDMALQIPDMPFPMFDLGYNIPDLPLPRFDLDVPIPELGIPMTDMAWMMPFPDACMPQTCLSLKVSCGMYPDGCGGFVYCPFGCPDAFPPPPPLFDASPPMP